jgi:hypothetical protein
LSHSRFRGFLRIRSLAIPVALSSAIAVFLFATNHNIPFANDGNCDPWFYFGRFFIADQAHALGDTRAGARLPATIIGYICTLIFDGDAADYANFLILFTCSATALYIAAKRLFGTYPAIVATIFFCTEPLIVGNFSVTFSAPAVAYSAVATTLAVGACTRPRSTSRTAELLGAGFFWGCAIHAHLYSLTYNFTIPLYCLEWRRMPLAAFLREVLARWSLLLVGPVIATVIFGLVNEFVLHDGFFFFMKQYEDTFTVLVEPYEKYHWYFLGGRGALLLTGLAAVVAQSLWLVRRGVDHREALAVLTVLVPFAALLLAQLVYTMLGGITLQYDYYFIWLIAPMALLIASLMNHVSFGRVVALCLIGVYLAASLAGDFGHLNLLWQRATDFPPSIAIAIPLAAALLWTRRWPARASLASLALLALLNATVRPDKFGIPLWEGGSGHDVYERVRMGMAFIARYRFPTRPMFWVTRRGDMWETIAYPRSYNYCLVDADLPDFVPPGDPWYYSKTELFAAGQYLVMTPQNRAVLEQALKNLEARDLTFDELARRRISYRGLSYLLVIGRLR